MESESRPGIASKIFLGNNYAQPSCSFEAVPGGNDLDRLSSYLGNRNCGSPWTSDEERAAESASEVGKRTESARAAERLLLERSYAVRPGTPSIFSGGSTFV